MNIEQLKSNKKDLEEKIASIELSALAPIEEQLANVKQEIAEKLCPFEVGDRVFYKKTGHEITKIFYRYGDYEMLGCKIKKDGTPGKQERTIYEWNPGDLVKV